LLRLKAQVAQLTYQLATSGTNNEVQILKNKVKDLLQNIKSLECEFEDMEKSYKIDIQSLQDENKVLKNQVNIPTKSPLLDESYRSMPLSFGPPAVTSAPSNTVSSHYTRTGASPNVKRPEKESLDHGDDVSSTDGSIVGGEGAEIVLTENKKKRKRVSYDSDDSDVEYEEDNKVDKASRNVIVIGDDESTDDESVVSVPASPAKRKRNDDTDTEAPPARNRKTTISTREYICRCGKHYVITSGENYRPMRDHRIKCNLIINRSLPVVDDFKPASYRTSEITKLVGTYRVRNVKNKKIL